MSDVEKRVVLITGASSGIGQACARRLASRGYRVFGTSRRPQAGEAEPFEMIRMDVTDDGSVRDGVAAVLARAGRLDVTVNNAGIGFAGAIEDTSLDEARELFETDFFGVLRVCRAVLPQMRAQRSGTIVNVSSLAGVVAVPFQGMYCAAKFALEGMTEALRLEVRPFGIRVALIEPGDAHTAFTANRRPTAASGPESAYAESMRRAMSVAEHEERTGIEAEAVARVLEGIARRRSPRLRYVVAGSYQRLGSVGKRLAPGGLFEWGIRRYYGIR